MNHDDRPMSATMGAFRGPLIPNMERITYRQAAKTIPGAATMTKLPDGFSLYDIGVTVVLGFVVYASDSVMLVATSAHDGVFDGLIAISNDAIVARDVLADADNIDALLAQVKVKGRPSSWDNPEISTTQPVAEPAQDDETDSDDTDVPDEPKPATVGKKSRGGGVEKERPRCRRSTNKRCSDPVVAEGTNVIRTDEGRAGQNPGRIRRHS